MAVEYTMAAHPTTYRGMRFRSRLEATWAAFFDRLGWQWEYEPFDLGKWSPDFLIRGAKRDALVEVKPTTIPDADVVQKMMHASTGYYLFALGVSPAREKWEKDYSQIYLPCSCCGMENVGCWRNRNFVSFNGRYDIVFGHDRYPGFVTGKDAEKVEINEYVGDEIDDLWAKAKNAVQWRPR